MKLSKLKYNPENPRRISPEQLDKLVKSIESLPKMMELRPIVYDPNTMYVLGGNQRLAALRKMGKTEVPDNWVKSADEMTEKEKREFILRDNVQSGEWDYSVLDENFADFDLDDIGIELPDSFGIDEPEITEDDYEQPDQIETDIKLGDLFSLRKDGKEIHRLLCGDATNDQHITKLFGENKPFSSIVFDPEWNDIPRAYYGTNVLAFCDGHTAKDIIGIYGAPAWIFTWDCVTSWYTPNRPLRRGKYCFWYGDVGNYNADGSHYGECGVPKTVTNTRGTYCYEPDIRGKHLSDVYQNPITQEHANTPHNHAKPLDWMRMLIANCTDGNIFDPYLGFGTSMVACHQIGRACYGIEICPENCQLAIDRMSNMFPNLDIIKIDSFHR